MTLSIDRVTVSASFTDAAIRLERVLQDIANKIQIESDFTLTYPEHQSLELPAQLQERFGQMPSYVQHNYLRVKLQQFLQYIYSGSESREELETSNKIENKAIKWSKSEFVQQLRRNNHSEGHFESGWQILGETEAGFLQVSKDELTLHICRDRHLRDVDKSAKIGDMVSVKMPPQLVEQGYYIAVGTAGSINDIVAQSNNPIVDIYFNISAKGSSALMNSFTIKLNAIEIPFHFKVLYRPEDYIYWDTAILSLVKNDYNRVKPIIATVYQENKAYFKPQTPLFTKYLASGISIAERPAVDLDLVQHRCQIIAEALITAWQQGQTSSADRLECIRDRLRQENINLEQPYLNPNSTDIYAVIPAIK